MSVTFGDIVREYRDKNNLSMGELSKLSGVSKAYIGMIEKGTDYRTGKPLKPSLGTLHKIARAMGLTLSELMRLAPDALVTFDDATEDEMIDMLDAPTNGYKESALDFIEEYENLHKFPGLQRKPRLGAIACGEPILAEQNIEDYDEVPDYIKCDFTLLCRGDSMINARIYDGDIVCIKKQDRVENGQIAAVLVNDEATLKRVRYIEGGVALWPENPEYEPLVYTGEAAEDVRIIGLATHFISTIK